MEETVLKLQFDDQAQAQSILEARFPDWDGAKTPNVNQNHETLVVIPEPVILNQNGDTLPGTWTKFHVDLCLYNNVSEYDSYWVSPDPQTPVHSF